MVWWESEEEWPFKSFSKLKTTIFKYLTLVKIKIGMTYVCINTRTRVKSTIVKKKKNIAAAKNDYRKNEFFFYL